MGAGPEVSQASLPGTTGILHKVTETRALIEKHYYRIDVIQGILAGKEMEEEEREGLLQELDELKAILQQSEAALHSLHDTNRETTKLATIFMFLVFGIYCIYRLVVNEK